MIWLTSIIISIAFIVGFYSYLSLKNRFDRIYRSRHILPKRIIHSIVYIIFLVLAYEGVRIKLQGSIGNFVLTVLAIIFFIIGLFIFGDIYISIKKMIKG